MHGHGTRTVKTKMYLTVIQLANTGTNRQHNFLTNCLVTATNVLPFYSIAPQLTARFANFFS